MKTLNFKRTAVLLLAAALLVLSPTYFYKKLTVQTEFLGTDYSGIIRVWHIDSFEGGRGSRADFLSARALEYEKQNTGRLVLVSVHTEQSAEEAFSRGDYPDVLSYGTGFSYAAGEAKPLSALDFPGGYISGKTYAYPWCLGGYALFTLKGENALENIKGSMVISRPGGAAAAAIDGITHTDFDEQEPLKAYVAFLNGEYDYMIGTQRDISRFAARGVRVNMRALSSFSDLYQYISILTSEPVKAAIAAGFINHLTSRAAQEKVSALYMLSAGYNIYNSTNTDMLLLEKQKPQSTLSAFTASVHVQEFYKNALNALKGDGEALKKIRNYTVTFEKSAHMM